MYIALEETNFIWDIKEVDAIKEYWDKKIPICGMADILKRPTNEVFLLLMDLIENGKIKGNVNSSFYGF